MPEDYEPPGLILLGSPGSETKLGYVYGITLDGNCLLRAFDVGVEVLEIPTDFPKSIREMHTTPEIHRNIEIAWPMLKQVPEVVVAAEKLFRAFCVASTLDHAGQHIFGETNIATSYRFAVSMLASRKICDGWKHLDWGSARGKHSFCIGRFLEILGARNVMCLGIEKNAEQFQHLQLLLTSYVSKQPAVCSSKIGIACGDSHELVSLEGVDSIYQYTGASHAKKTSGYKRFMVRAFTTASLKIIADTFMSPSLFDTLDLPDEVKKRWYVVTIRKCRQGKAANSVYMWVKRPGLGELPGGSIKHVEDPLLQSMIAQAQTPLHQRVERGITTTAGIEGIPHTQSGDEVYQWGVNCHDAVLDKLYLAGCSRIQTVVGDVGSSKQTSYLYVGVAVNTTSGGISFILLVEAKQTTFLLDSSSVVLITSTAATPVVSSEDLKCISETVCAPVKRTRATVRKEAAENKSLQDQETKDHQALVQQLSGQLDDIQKLVAQVSKRQKLVENKTKIVEDTHKKNRNKKDKTTTKIVGLETKVRGMQQELNKAVKNVGKTDMTSLKTKVTTMATQLKEFKSQIKSLDTTKQHQLRDKDQKAVADLKVMVTALQSEVSGWTGNQSNRKQRSLPPVNATIDKSVLHAEFEQLRKDFKLEVDTLQQQHREQQTQAELRSLRAELAAAKARDEQSAQAELQSLRAQLAAFADRDVIFYLFISII